MSTLITVVHCVTCVLLILVIMIQSGKGADISASFAGSSQTVFGSSGGANFFVRFTQVAAGIFMATSLALTMLGSQDRKSIFEGQSSVPLSAPASAPLSAPVKAPADPTAPVAPARAAPASAAKMSPGTPATSATKK